jgi:hypothetical protein
MHSFDPEIAARVGVNAAVVYQNIFFWTRKNLANSRHVRDGKVWTYNSVKAWSDLFPYLTGNQIRTALAKLTDAGLVSEGNYNETAYDRTKWYGVSVEIHLGKIANGVGENHEPIPDSKPVQKTDDKPDVSLDERRDERGPIKVRLPEEWVPSQDDLEYARSMKLTDKEITEIADDFHAYWCDRTDAGGRKSARGWSQAWRNRVRDQAPRYIRSRGMAFGAPSRGSQHGGSIAAIVARRQFEG